MALPNIANLYNLSRPTSKKVASIDYFFLQISQLHACAPQYFALYSQSECHTKTKSMSLTRCNFYPRVILCRLELEPINL